MKRNKLYLISLLVSTLCLLIGSLFKITHWPGGSQLVTIGLISALVYIFIGILFLFEDKEKSMGLKLLWILGFFFFSFITAWFFYFLEIKNPKAIRDKNVL